MKKVKTLLVTAAAALSLSACSFSDITSFAGDAKDKTVGAFNSLLETVGLKKKEEKKACEHSDANHDGKCDLCGEEGLPYEHTDANHDHKCDVCGAEISTHKDEDNDFKCDYCGAELKIASVRLDIQEAETIYSKDDEFSSKGVKVIATSEVGSEKELEFSTSTPDMSVVGDQKVTVTYENDGEKSFEYTINVSYWSSEDLEVFAAGSFTDDAPLPYLPGHEMHTKATWEGEGEDAVLVEWSIVVDDASAEVLLEYYNRLKDYNKVVQLYRNTSSGKVLTDVHFELIETGLDGEGYHGLSDVSVFALVPYFLDEKGYGERLYIYDEYFVLGVNEEGQLVLESKLVESFLDGFFFGNEFADGSIGFPAQYNSYQEYLPYIIDEYFSEYSAKLFVIPTLNSAASFVPVSYHTMYPLSEGFDEYDLAWAIQYSNATPEVATYFVEALLDAGYQEIIHPATEDYEQYSSYVYYDEFAGTMEYEVDYYPAEGEHVSAVVVNFFFNAPASYTNHLSPVAKAICQFLGSGEEYDIYDDLYSHLGVSVGLFDAIPAEGENSYSIISGFGRKLVDELGLIVTEELSTQGDEETGYYYSVTLADENYTYEICVDSLADLETGAYAVEIYVSDTRKAPSLSKVEAEAQALNFNAYGTHGLRGEDYTISSSEEGEVAKAIVKFDETESAEFAQDFEGAAMMVANHCLPSSYELASSEQREDGSWAVTYNDIQRGFQVVFVAKFASSESSMVVVELEIRAVSFITPESVMVEYLTALNGSAPSSEDLSVAEDHSCSAHAAIEDAEASAEGLAAAAAKFVKAFGESFQVTNEGEGEEEGTYVVLLANEVSGIDAQIVVSFTEGVGYSAELFAQFHVEEVPVEVRADEEALIALLTNFWGEGQIEDGDYSYDEQQDVFVTKWFVFNSNYADESYNQPIAEYIAGFAPETFSVAQADAATVANTYNSYVIVLVDATAGVVLQITVFVHPGAGANAYQIAAYTF